MSQNVGGGLLEKGGGLITKIDFHMGGGGGGLIGNGVNRGGGINRVFMVCCSLLHATLTEQVTHHFRCTVIKSTTFE